MTFDRQSLPASVETVCLFVAHLSETMEYSSVANYVSGLVTFHNLNDFQSPEVGHFSVKQALAGLKRERVELPHKKDALLPAHLKAILNHLHIVPEEIRVAFWGACLVAFFSLLRKSNLFAGSPRSVSHLRVDDVTYKRTSVDLRVRVIKTSRFLNTEIQLPLVELKDNPLCPVKIIKTLLQTPGMTPESSLFSYVQNGVLVPLNAERFVYWLRQSLRLTDLVAENFSIHSFRKGAATFSSACGVTADELKAQGNWRSDCFKQYILRDAELRKSFAKTVRDGVVFGGFG